jgi:hypothetical protein
MTVGSDNKHQKSSDCPLDSICISGQFTVMATISEDRMAHGALTIVGEESSLHTGLLPRIGIPRITVFSCGRQASCKAGKVGMRNGEREVKE